MLSLFALKVLILAGGLDAEQNHHSHLVHVQALQALLAARGVPAADVAVFWADGAHPAPDRSVVRATAPEADGWLLDGLDLARDLEVPPELENTVLPGARPASRAALKAWLAEVGPGLGAEDTLLIAVTDHGSPDPAGGTLSHIELWGGETWNPKELLEDLAPVPEPARVVLWMSQCFSGGFADLFRQRPNLCGTFSASADRVAYGCYPDLAERSDVGHFQRLVRALERTGSLAAATDEIALTDDTPDVPHLTSDALLFAALTREAERGNSPIPTFIDTRLTAMPEVERLAARIALRYGLGHLRDYSALADVLDAIGAARYAADSWGEAWRRAYDNARAVLLEPALRAAGEPGSAAVQRKARARALVAARKLLSQAPAEQRETLLALRDKAGAADTLVARLDLQEAAALRIGWLLGRRAGGAVLESQERRQWAALQACETTPLFAVDPPPDEVPTQVYESLPPAVAAGAEAERLRPGHLGLAFRDRPGYVGVEVERIQPGSVLLAVDLRAGDLLQAVNGRPILRRGGLREAVMLTEPGRPLRLTGRRGAADLIRALVAPPMPLPAPTPLIGEVVGDLRLKALDGPLPALGEGHPVVLFFWATWCKPCKAALPLLKTWATTHNVPVLAITDEDPAVVQKFLSHFGRFPFPIGLDVEDEARRLFGADAVPVFVLVDRERRLLQVSVGFEGQVPLEPPPG